MPCYHPVTAWRSKQLNANGNRPLVFVEAQGLDNSQLEIPCGQCVGCRLDNARSWAIRLMHERHYHDLCCFLTLTYDAHNLPNPPSVDHRHFQLFMKRLRKYHHYANPDAPKIKYYMCGEYGGNTNRPHYHAIVFGLDFADKRKWKKGKRGDQIYTSEKLNELWGLGYCWIGSVTHQSAGYVARYCLKKVNGDRADEHYSIVNKDTGEIVLLNKEYMAASNGLGLAHFEEHHQQMYIRDSCVVAGNQVPVPKYYDRKLKAINPELLEDIKLRRKERAIVRKVDNTPERLAVRKAVKEAQVALLKRELE